MKVTRVVQPQYLPVTLGITFDTAEELELIQFVFKRHILLPRLLRTQGDLPAMKETELSALMEHVHHVLTPQACG